MKNYSIIEVCTQRKDYPDAQSTEVQDRMLQLPQYTELARRMIGRFAPANVRTMMLNSDDAVSFVAGQLMMGDWDFDPARRTKLNTYRGRRGKWAINAFLRSLKEDEWAVSLDEESPADETQNRHALISDPTMDNPLVSLMEDEEFAERRHYIQELLSVPYKDGGLSTPMRQCVEMYFLDGMKPFQIAERLGVRRQAVQTTLKRAMRRLKKTAGVPA